MKYLVTITGDSTTPLPPEQALAIWQAAKEWVGARLKDGTIEGTYGHPDGGGFAIANVDSHEALLDTLMAYPLYPFFTWEVKVIVDWRYVYDKVIESLQA